MVIPSPTDLDYYRPILVKIDARNLSYRGDRPTNKQTKTHKQTHTQDRLQ